MMTSPMVLMTSRLALMSAILLAASYTPCNAADCHCSQSDQWTPGSFTIENVAYDLNKTALEELQPTVLVTHSVVNLSKNDTQSIEYNVTETKIETSEFSHTSGIKIENGMQFQAGIPQIGFGSVSLSGTVNYAYNSGESKFSATSIEHEYTCHGAPEKHTECIVTEQNVTASVPYTMTLKHNDIPECTCESSGVWRGLKSYQCHLISHVRDIEEEVSTPSAEVDQQSDNAISFEQGVQNEVDSGTKPDSAVTSEPEDQPALFSSRQHAASHGNVNKGKFSILWISLDIALLLVLAF